MALSGYQIDEPYQTGCSGVIWRGHSDAGEPVLIKFLPASLASGDRHRLRILTQLQHPCLANLRTWVELPGRVALVWDFVEGTSLTALLGDNSLLSPRQRKRIAVDIASAINHLHEHGLAHGDLSPNNVIVNPTAAVLIDLYDSASESTSARGTSGYTAAELQVAGESASVDQMGADRWAWGKLATALGVEDEIVKQCLLPVSIRASRADLADWLSRHREPEVSFTGPPQTPSPEQILRAHALSERTTEVGPRRLRTRSQSHPPRRRHRRNSGCVKAEPVWLGRGMRVGLSALILLGGVVTLGISMWGPDHTSAAADVPKMKAQVLARKATSGESTGSAGLAICPTTGQAQAVLQDLLARRNTSIVERDPTVTSRVYTAESSLKERDLQVISTLLSNDQTISDLSSELEVSSVSCLQEAVVKVDSWIGQSNYQRCQGDRCESMPADPPRHLQVTLVGKPWRILHIESVPNEG